MKNTELKTKGTEPARPTRDPDCKGCQRTGMNPTHNGSRLCESGSIASGGTRAHCTCDMCF